MELEKLESPDALKDYKHNLPSSVYIPTVPTGGKVIINICFCDCCRKMTTEWEIKRYGCCPKCRGHKFRGGWETPFERLKLQWWVLTNNWRVTGKWKRSEQASTV